MRKSTFFWLALAAFCGIALFHTSQKTHANREKIATLTEAAAREEESIRVLRAEWSYLNQPERLEKLAKNYLALAPLKGSQFAKVGDLAVAPPEPPEDITAEMPVAPKPAVAAAPAIKPPVKINKPAVHAFASPTLPRPAAKTSVRPATASTRGFGDVMKSLGIRQ